MAGAPDYFDDLKNYLDITYVDSEVDAKLIGICRRAEAHLRVMIGDSDLKFAAAMPDQAVLQLLFDCCRYIRSNALEEFDLNYASEIWALRANHHIRTAELEEGEEDD